MRTAIVLAALAVSAPLTVITRTQAQDAGEPIRNRSSQASTGALLGEYSGWVWIRDARAAQWRKLIPGACPQWTPDGQRFYYFLDVGYDGSRAELWSADAAGDARIRESKADYFIGNGPVVVSPDNRRLAFVYQTSRASGGFEDVVVIDLRPRFEGAPGRVVLRTKAAIDPVSLRWTAPGQLSVLVAGVRSNIDATAAGLPQAQ